MSTVLKAKMIFELDQGQTTHSESSKQKKQLWLLHMDGNFLYLHQHMSYMFFDSSFQWKRHMAGELCDTDYIMEPMFQDLWPWSIFTPH